MEGLISRDYRRSFRELKERVRGRLRIRSIWPSRARDGVPCKGKARMVASAASTVVAARVFKGNVVFAKLTTSLASKLSKNSFSQGDPASVAGHSFAASNTHTARLLGAFKAKFQTSESEAQDPLPPTAATSSVRQATSESLATTSTPLQDQSPIVSASQQVAVPLFGNAARAFMLGLNSTEIVGGDKLLDAVENRLPGQALVTVCNHVAAMDDPLVLAAILPSRLISQPSAMRWTLCASDRCFKNAIMGNFFRALKVIPVERGAGLEQEGMAMAARRLRRGDWVHLFPEGSRSRDGGKTLGQMKRGVGRLVADLDHPPLVLPFVHSGMEEIQGKGRKLPAVGKKVRVLVGDPIDVSDLLEEYRWQRQQQQEQGCGATSSSLGGGDENNVRLMRDESDGATAGLLVQTADIHGAGGQARADASQALLERPSTAQASNDKLQTALYDAIAARIGVELHRLKAQLHEMELSARLPETVDGTEEEEQGQQHAGAAPWLLQDAFAQPEDALMKAGLAGGEQRLLLGYRDEELSLLQLKMQRMGVGPFHSKRGGSPATSVPSEGHGPERTLTPLQWLASRRIEAVGNGRWWSHWRAASVTRAGDSDPEPLVIAPPLFWPRAATFGFAS